MNQIQNSKYKFLVIAAWNLELIWDVEFVI